MWSSAIRRCGRWSAEARRAVSTGEIAYLVLIVGAWLAFIAVLGWQSARNP